MAQLDDRERFKPDVLPPRVGEAPSNFKPSAKDAFQQGFRDALKEIEREAIWQSSQKGGAGGKFELPKFARIQSCVDDWIKQSQGIVGTQFLYEFYSR